MRYIQDKKYNDMAKKVAECRDELSASGKLELDEYAKGMIKQYNYLCHQKGRTPKRFGMEAAYELIGIAMAKGII